MTWDTQPRGINGVGVVSGLDNGVVTATGSTTPRSLATRFAEVINVKDYGALGDGTDDRTAIVAAYTAASHGDILYFPRPTSYYYVSAGITIAKRLHLLGAMSYGAPTDVSGSQIRGSGFTIFTMQEPFVMENLTIYDPTGHASTIGVDINDGVNGVVKWTIKNCTINCSTATFGTLGTGIRGIFALEGTIENSTIEGWLNGIDWQATGGAKSNANKLFGNRIRQNTIGLLVTSADNAFLTNNTIEGNSTGVKCLEGKLIAVGNHFENNLGSQREIHMVGGNLTSIGNGFYAGGTDKDIYIEAGAGIHTSISDTLNAGVKHNGTGLFTLTNPTLAPIVSGTGPIIQTDGLNVKGLQGTSSRDFTFTGFSSIQMNQHMALTEVGNPSGTANQGKLYVRDNGAGKSQLCVIFGTGVVQVIATEP